MSRTTETPMQLEKGLLLLHCNSFENLSF